MKISKHIMLGHETNFKTVVGGYEKSPQDIHKEIHIIFLLHQLKQSGALVGL